MTVFWSILIAVLVFGFLIMIHELGHFSVARWCGIKIDEFSIGMGPQLCGKKSKKTGTLFSIRVLPIGGYVSMLGEQEACEEEGSFSQKNVWQRIAVVVAGATMNLIVGFIIVFVIVCIAAASGKIATTTIADFQKGATSCEAGGLALGDQVIKVGNVRVHTGEELTYEITSQGDEPVDLTVIRNGSKVILSDVVFPTAQESGITFGSYDFYVLALKDPGLLDLFKYSFWRSVSLIKMVWDSLYNLIIGKYGVAQLSGPVGVTAAVADTVANSNWNGMQIFNYALSITSLISINLGVFNLIPFPALDGGRLFFLLFEAITKKRIPADVEAKINFGGMVLLMGLMLFVVCKDIVTLF